MSLEEISITNETNNFDNQQPVQDDSVIAASGLNQGEQEIQTNSSSEPTETALAVENEETGLIPPLDESQPVQEQPEADAPAADLAIEQPVIQADLAADVSQEDTTTPAQTEDAPKDTAAHDNLDSAADAPAAAAPLEKIGAISISAPAEHTHERRTHIRNEVISDEVFGELKLVQESAGNFEVEVKSRIRGGLRVVYKNYPLFLPASHYSIKRNPPEKELQEAIGKKIKVGIHELTEDENGIRTVIVSRKKIVEEEFWGKINTGDIVEGFVSSIATFGVFVDIGGVEGLIHISRLSKVHVDDPKKFAKKGQKIQAVVIEIDKEKHRIALSRKELEKSPWHEIEQEFPAGSRHKGIVRRIAEFGAYVEMKPGVDGLLRTSELSWTKRLKTPADLLKPGDEIDIEVMAVSEEKQTLSLSYKRTTPNPWEEIKEKFPVGSLAQAKIMQLIPQGAIVRIGDEVDGFMPRSKMKAILKGKKIPYHVGDDIEVIISDINPSDESMILAPKVEEEAESSQPSRDNRRPGNDNRKDQQIAAKSNEGAFTLFDLISDKEMKSLYKTQE